MEIMRGAALCFEERGFARTSLDEVAARIQSTKGRIYHHYRSKAELFFDVYRTGMAMNQQAIDPLLTAELPAIDRLIGMARAHIRSVIATKPFQNVVWEGVDMLRQGAMPGPEHAQLRELAELRDNYGLQFLGAMEAARAEGAIRFDTSKIALNQFFMCLNGPIIWFSARPGQTEAEIEQVADECAFYAMRLLGYHGPFEQTPSRKES